MSTTPDMERHKHCAKLAETLREMGESQAKIEEEFNKCYRSQPDDNKAYQVEIDLPLD